MNCADFEILICDYVDGTLDAAGKAALQQHLAGCSACAELARDSAAAVAFMERAADVEPPQELVTRILFDAPWNVEKAASKKRTWLAALLGPVLQPRIVMGMAMTMLSLSMMVRFMGPKPLRASDFRPAAVWNGAQNRAEYAWNRTVVFFEHLKIVYQIQTALQKLQQQQEEDQPAVSPAPATNDHQLPMKSAPGTSGSTPSGGGSK